MDPQQGTRFFLTHKGITFDEPCRGHLVVGGSRSIVIYGRVW